MKARLSQSLLTDMKLLKKTFFVILDLKNADYMQKILFKIVWKIHWSILMFVSPKNATEIISQVPNKADDRFYENEVLWNPWGKS